MTRDRRRRDSDDNIRVACDKFAAVTRFRRRSWVIWCPSRKLCWRSSSSSRQWPQWWSYCSGRPIVAFGRRHPRPCCCCCCCCCWQWRRRPAGSANPIWGRPRSWTTPSSAAGFPRCPSSWAATGRVVVACVAVAAAACTVPAALFASSTVPDAAAPTVLV